MLPILNELLRRIEHGEHLAFCSIVRSRGSTPQKTGATMLVLADGQLIGTLGGGCVEAEVRSRALKALVAGADELVSFKLDHDYGWDDGMVCGGSLDVAIQILSASRDLAFIHDAREKLQQRQPGHVRISLLAVRGESTSFELPFTPTPRLVIAGAGHVAMALASVAGPLGFELVILDDRPDFASDSRFPGARCIIGDIGLELSRQSIDSQTYVVIVTRGHRNDGHALASVIRSDARYIGLIGSKRKIRTLLHDLDQQGVSRDALLKLYAPIGLQIGAITPAEIAISIAAELVAIRRNATLPVDSMKLHAAELTRWLDLLPPRAAE